MSNWCHGIHLKYDDLDEVLAAINKIMNLHSLQILSDDKIPQHQTINQDGWANHIYLVVVPPSPSGWISLISDATDDRCDLFNDPRRENVYRPIRALAQELSATLGCPVLFLWVNVEHPWGYAYWESGTIRDEFNADAVRYPESMSPEELTRYTGKPDLLAKLVPSTDTAQEIESTLRDKHLSDWDGAGRLAWALDIPAGLMVLEDIEVPGDELVEGFAEAFGVLEDEFELIELEYASGLE